MAAPTRYRKKPVEIDAYQWEGGAEAATPIINWILDSGGTARYHEVRTTDTSVREETGEEVVFPRTHPVPEYIAIDTLEGTMKVSVKDYIIKGVQGEFYPCKPDIFEQTYEKVATFNQHTEDPDQIPAFVLAQEQASAAPGDLS